VHLGQKVEYRQTLTEVVICQAMNGNDGVIALEERKVFRVDGKAERTANNSIFLGHVI